jgi:allophanate hydrolase
MVTVQDDGRPGWLAEGMSRGGAMDMRARAEAAALLGGDAGAGLETPTAPLRLRFGVATTVALTGAPMRATTGGRALVWHAAHPIEAGAELDLRPERGGGQGAWSYLHVAGGLRTEPVMGGRGTHLAAGLGRAARAGDAFPMTEAPRGRAVRLAERPDRFEGGTLRLVTGPQTGLFDVRMRERLAATAFHRDVRGNRQGIRIATEADASFAAEGQLMLLSEFVVPGDVQMAGDGQPYILGPECQTTGGYPRIGTVIPADLPRAMQAPPGAPIRLAWIDRRQAVGAAPEPPAVVPLTLRPEEVPDLLTRQLIGGVITGRETA